MDKKEKDVEADYKIKEGCIAELNIKTGKKLIEDAKKRALKLINRSIEIDGFRKGKVPKEFILKNYPQKVDQETRSEIISIAFMEAQKELKIFPLNRDTKIDYKLKNFSEDGAEIFFSYETHPTPPKVDPKKFSLKAIKKNPVTEEAVDEHIRQVRFFFAEWKDVDRAIQDGDFVIIDLDTIEPPGRVFSDTRFEVTDRSIAKWMKSLLLGAKKGDIIEGISEADEEVSEKEKKDFQPKKVKITIKKVEEATLPPLDDNFAKRMQEKDLPSFRESMRKLLEKTEKERVEQDEREQVNEFLTMEYSFDLPASVLEKEKNYRKNKLIEKLKESGKWDKTEEKDREYIEKSTEKQARDSLLLFYISQKIIEDENIQITKDDIKKESEVMKKSSEESLQKNLTKKELENVAFYDLCLKRAQDFILNYKKKGK